MTGYSTASSMIRGGGSVRWSMAETRGAHPVQRSRWRKPRRTGAATALAAVLIAGTSIQALAQTANEVWAGCTLTTDAGGTVEGLEANILKGPDIADNDDLQVAFVVVYSLKNDNDGQPLDGGGFTGPVICTNPAVVDAPVATSQTDNIGSPTDTVTILDAEEAFLLQYQFDNAPTDIEKRFCHTVNSETNCFLIKPLTID